jgi:vacuolar-type H+-ATPase subunit H
MKAEDTSFMKTIEDVKTAEAESLKLKEGANEKAQNTLRAGKREAEEMRLEGEKKSLEAKEKIISEGKKSTEGEVKKILSSAEKEAGKIRGGKAGAKDISLLLDDFLGSFNQ